MPNIFGWNFDLIPGVNVTKSLNDARAAGKSNFGADAVSTALNIASPDYDVIPGLDINKHPSTTSTSRPPVQPGNDELDTSQQIADGGYGGTGGSSAASAVAKSFYDAGISNIDALIASLPSREASALSALMNSYLQTKGRQDVEYGDNQADFNKNIDKVTRDDARKKTQIDTNVRNDTSNLMRLLGSRGAGSSSASKEVVPRQVAQKGASERSDASQVTADNMDELNTNFNRYDREWKQRRADTDTDYQNNQRDISSQFAQQGIDARQKRMELDSNRAAASGGDAGAIARASSSAGEINTLQQKINDLAARAAGRTITNQDLAMQSSQQKAFNDPTNTSTAQNGGVADDSSAYYDPTIQKKTDDDLLKELFGI